MTDSKICDCLAVVSPSDIVGDNEGRNQTLDDVVDDVDNVVDGDDDYEIHHQYCPSF